MARTPQRERTGRCPCGQLAYCVEDDPIIVHCCHCSTCQRETGTAFAFNYLVEAAKVRWTGRAEQVVAQSASGRGQTLVRCADCHGTVSSHYGMGPGVHFLRVGTMDDKGGISPDAHIFTSTKLDWVRLDPDTPAFDDIYDPKTFWDAATMDRVRAAKR